MKFVAITDDNKGKPRFLAAPLFSVFTSFMDDNYDLSLSQQVFNDFYQRRSMQVITLTKIGIDSLEE